MKTNEEILQEALIHILKNPRDIDICLYCKNKLVCKGCECEHFVSGVGDAEGKWPDMKWTCEDFNFGTCTLLENTPCNGCIQNNYSGFELDMNKLRNANCNHQISYEEDDFLPHMEKWAQVDVHFKCGCQFSTLNDLAILLFERFGWIVDTDGTYGVDTSGEYPIYTIRVLRTSFE